MLARVSSKGYFVPEWQYFKLQEFQHPIKKKINILFKRLKKFLNKLYIPASEFIQLIKQLV